LRTLCAFSILV